MLVENKEKRVLGVPYGKAVLLLHPRINNVDDKVWAEVKKAKFVKRRLGDTLEEVGVSAPEDKGLADLAPLKAMEVVRGTLDLALLRQWEDKEKRKKVQKALEKQIQTMEAGREVPQGADAAGGE